MKLILLGKLYVFCSVSKSVIRTTVDESVQIIDLSFSFSSRNCLDWLKENYTSRNGFPSFYDKGHYSYENKSLAEQEYRLAVAVASSSGDHLFAN